MLKYSALLKLRFSHKADLPSSLHDALVNESKFEVAEILNRLCTGEVLLTVRHHRLYNCEQQRLCRIDKDYLYFRHQLQQCTIPLYGLVRHKEEKVDLRRVHIRLGYQKNCAVNCTTDGKCCNYFSVVFINSPRLPLNFIAQSDQSAKEWVFVLNYLKKKISNLHPRLQFELAAWEHFNSSKLNRRGQVTWRDAKKVFLKQGFVVPKKVKFENKRRFHHRALNFEEYFQHYKTFSLQQAIKFIFDQISADQASLTARELYKFIHEIQQEVDVTIKECEEIIEAFEVDGDSRNSKQMSILGFNLYMMSSYCELFNRKHDKVYQDMSRPLSHYYIASSHNTYLLGNQLTEQSSVDAYMNVLLKGCRCVELDCWDGPDDDPIVYHGYTLTSKIKFKDVVEVVGKYAFESSEYPLILSLENHCSLPQQDKMAHYLKTILGSELLTEPLHPIEISCSLPSPSALKGKILVKGKTLSSKKPTVDQTEIFEEVTLDETKTLVNEAKEKSFRYKLRNSLRRSKSTTSSVRSTESTASSNEMNDWKVSPSLSDLVIYCKSVKFTSFEEAESSFAEMSSFSEGKSKKMAKANVDEVIEYHKCKLSRTYPSGTRADSSNYDPQPLWNAGFQIVALNYQTQCVEMDINTGKFRQNGNCGYVLKPDFQRLPATDGEQFRIPMKHLRIYIICGPQHKRVDYELELEVFGDREDNMKSTAASCYGKLDIEERSADFYCVIKNSELAMLRFVLRDDSLMGETIGQYSLPFTSVSQGYRHIPFFDEGGARLKGISLLVYVIISEKTSSES